jgi:O-antigen/teichoic acid export membrane protein
VSSSRSRPSHAARSILSNWATFAFAAGVNFVLSPIVVRSLGATQYGAWVLLVSMVGYLGLLDLGVRGAVTRYVAMKYASSDHAGANQIYAAALRLFLGGAVIALAIAGVMSGLVGLLFNIPAELVPIARVVTLIGGLNVAATLVSGVFGGVVIGLQRFDYNNAAEILLGALRAVAVVVALKTGHGLIALALVQLVAAVARGVASAAIVQYLYPEIHLGRIGWDRESARMVVTFGLTSAVLYVSTAVMLYSDSLVIGAMLPVGMVTFFAIAGNLSEYARSVVSGVTQPLAPRVAALQAQGDQAGGLSAIVASARLSSLVMMPIAITFMLRGASFVGLWMGPSYADMTGRILLILSISLLIGGGYSVITVAMIGLNTHRALIPIFIGEAVANFALSVLCVHLYGVVGSAIGTTVPRVITSVLVLPQYAHRVVGLPLRSFYTTVVLRPIIAMIPFAVTTYAIEQLLPAHHLITFFGQVALALPVAGLGAWILCVPHQDKIVVRQWLGRLTARTA